MLVILSGVETIHKKFFARKISAALNTFTVDGHMVDFSIEPFKVTDASGKVVYCMEHDDQPMTNELLVDLDNDGVFDPEGNATFEKITKLSDDLFLTGGRNNHFSNFFIDLAHDFGLTDTVDYGSNTPKIPLLHPHSYADVLANYENRLGDVHVITGIFSKSFIDSVRNDIGAENVTVINIVRNPSTCILLNRKDDEYYANPEKNRTPELDARKLVYSIANAAVLAQFDDITTIKFEDAIIAGKFIVNGIEVKVPTGYDNFNGLLTQWEHENLIPLEIVSAETLDTINLEMQHYASRQISSLTTDIVTYLNSLRSNAVTQTELETLMSENMPENLFTALGYEPLTYDDIVD
jgi:hypothetical protein